MMDVSVSVSVDNGDRYVRVRVSGVRVSGSPPPPLYLLFNANSSSPPLSIFYRNKPNNQPHSLLTLAKVCINIVPPLP
jgi:hypothetical protein